MRFVFTLPVATRKGSAVQEVVADYQANSLQELYEHVQAKGQKLFLVKQFYMKQTDGGVRKWEFAGNLLVNVDWCAKIKEFSDNDQH